MCPVEAGRYPAAPKESVLCHVVASVGVLHDAVGVLRRAGPPCGLVSRFSALERKMGGLHVV